MSEKRKEFMERISTANDEELNRQKEEYFKKLEGLDHNGGNLFWGARLQSEEIRNKKMKDTERD